MSSNGHFTPASADKFVLIGLDGELVRVRILVEPWQLEELLDTLASLNFPVNPELHYEIGSVCVEFPAYAGHVEDVTGVLKDRGFDPSALEVSRMLYAPAASIQGAARAI